MSKPLVPFALVPGYWGLKGKSKARAKAEYELEGYELDVALANINLEDKELSVKLLDIEKKYDKISERVYETAMVALVKTGVDQQLDLNYLDFKYKDITEKEFDKRRATISNEPWVDIVNLSLDKTNVAQGAMELDWNEAFIEYIGKAGYTGATPEEAVDSWLVEVCKNLALEELKNYMTPDEVEEFGEHVRSRQSKKPDMTN